MNEPQAVDYGLTPQQIERFDGWRKTPTETVGCYLPFVGALVGGAWGFLGGEFLLHALVVAFLFALYGFSVGLMVGLGISITWLPVGSVLSARLRSYRRYTAACDRYQGWLVRTRADHWRALSGIQFEAELGALFQRAGFEVTLTPPSGDEGVDLVLRAEGKRTVVQCKATAKPVGPGVVRELYGTLTAKGADEAIIASLAGVTEGAQSFMRGKPIRLLDLQGILTLQAKHPPPSE